MVRRISLMPAALLLAAVVVCAACTQIETPLRQVTFTAGNGTKTVLGDGGAVLWTGTDRLSVLDGEADRLFTRTGNLESSGSARFTGSVSSSATEFYVISPYQADLTLGAAGKVCGLTLPSAQTPVAGTFDPSAAILCAHSTDLETGTVQLHNLSSFLIFTPIFDCSRVDITSPGGEALAGSFSVTVGDGGVPGAIISDKAESTVTLSGASITAGKTYVVGVLPATLSKGLKITFTSTAGQAYTRSKTGSVTLSAGHGVNLGSFTTAGTWDGPAIEAVKLSRDAVGLLRGKEYTLDVTLTPANAKTASLNWRSSDPAVASVSAAGKVTAKKAGSCTISASSGGVTASCAITVVAACGDVFRYGYSELSELEKREYEYMLERLLAFEENQPVYGGIEHRVYLDFTGMNNSIQFSDIQRLTNIIQRDVPEAFLLANYIPRYDYSTYQVYLRVDQLLTTTGYASKMETIYAARDELLEGLEEKTEFEKALALHDRFIKRTNYGDMTSAAAGTIVGGLINKRVVCEGYARTYLFLCQQAGLKAIYIGGSKRTSEETDDWVNHSWNDVNVGGSWYMVDCTEDGALVGSTVGHRYFLVGKTKSETIHNYLSIPDFYGERKNENTNGAYKSLPTLAATDYPMTR